MKVKDHIIVDCINAIDYSYLNFEEFSTIGIIYTFNFHNITTDYSYWYVILKVIIYNSFGRLKPRNAFIGGFVIERKNAGVFKIFKNAPSLVVELSITDEQYNNISDTIKKFEQNKEEYKYDFVNLTIFFTKYRIPRKKRFFCSQFVAYILNNAGITTPNPPEHAQATDFVKMENSRVIYNGIIQEYSIEKTIS